ncbi:mandelate racemase/muconate lactonizing enzyme family protein [Plastoroseomonas hellenica]|uniref:mandelate racemase/muconate lactonizing enzyme family protein n=1 Tax=Plastoroseomonas hellenica TaxID=2687306 RepID=UPI001BAC1F35|nr:mandelate racemase/muconate lactonizing enzyme family protein [Plastoroseomonas hellenica]MBR0646147.1 mandelate racemase/muconate lactonizing enzyme family protein [Plastoroseomonas hellenica]
MTHTDPLADTLPDTMARIARIALHPVVHVMGDANAYGMARGLVAARGATIVEIETNTGVTGFGEAWGPPGFCAAYLDFVAADWRGARLTDHGALFHRIIARNYHFGVQNGLMALLSGLDMAVHDALGKEHGLPAHALIGGRARDAVPVYGSGGYFTADPAQGLAAQLPRFRDFTCCKIKIGRGIADDVARVRLARETLGDAMRIAVDANGNYGVDQVLASMRAIAPFGIEWYEEPLSPADEEGYRALMSRRDIPVATGEALYTAFAFDRLLAPRAIDIAQPDLALCGGLSQGRLIGQLCTLRHARLSPHCWGTGLGLAAAVQLVAAQPAYPAVAESEADPPWVEYDVADNPLRDELLLQPLLPTSGMIAVPAGPGLGVEPDRAALERFRPR